MVATNLDSVPNQGICVTAEAMTESWESLYVCKNHGDCKVSL